MSKLLYTIKDIFTSFLKDNQKLYFNVPEYQRGYKWNADNVQTLLNDLKVFEDSKPTKEQFYCLQNITIVPDKQNVGYNVVDGQQRLTTIYILLSYLRKNNKIDDFNFSPDCLRYSVREETEKVLKDKISTGLIWDAPINPNCATHKDEWYILDVAYGIKEWFEGENAQILSADTIVNKLQLIVNQMESGNETSIFAGLNGGKVDLDGADLVRAELITRAAREKYGVIDPQKVGEFRAHIGLKLDDISRWWGESYHQVFYNQMLPDIKTGDEFKNDTPINTLYKLYYLAYKNKEEDFGFRFFEHGRDFNKKQGDDHWELYDTLIQMHTILKSWYEDPAIYHWLGYLFFNFKGRKEANFTDIWTHWITITEDRDAFVRYIQSLIRTVIITPDPDESIESAHERLIDNIKNLQFDWYHDYLLDKILVLTEILWLEENQFKNWLSPEFLRQHDEQREHIRSCHPNPKEGSKLNDAQQWQEFIKVSYDQPEDLELQRSLLDLIESFKTDSYSEEQIGLINQKMNEYAQNSIGNLVLLHKHVNMSYGNAMYKDKVQRIIKEYMTTDWYIRPYTLNVFLKKINDDDITWRWSKVNIEENANEVAERVLNFFNMK